MKATSKPMTTKQVYKKIYSAKRDGSVFLIYCAVRDAVRICDEALVSRLVIGVEITYRRKMRVHQANSALTLGLRLLIYKSRKETAKIDTVNEAKNENL